MRNLSNFKAFQTIQPYVYGSIPMLSLVLRKGFKSNGLGWSKNRTNEQQILFVPAQCPHKEIIYQKKNETWRIIFHVFFSLGMSIVYICSSQGSPTTVNYRKIDLLQELELPQCQERWKSRRELEKQDQKPSAASHPGGWGGGGSWRALEAVPLCSSHLCGFAAKHLMMDLGILLVNRVSLTVSPMWSGGE